MGWARKKIKGRKENKSGTEKDAVVTMTHQTKGQFQLFDLEQELIKNKVTDINFSLWHEKLQNYLFVIIDVVQDHGENCKQNNIRQNLSVYFVEFKDLS